MLIVSLKSKNSLTIFFITGSLLASIWIEGCSEHQSVPYDRQTVTTFAELSILYEKEKMAQKVTDSLYQVRIDSFFLSKGTTKEAFKERIDKISSDNIIWKGFIQQTTRAIDSLKAVAN